ncbi:helix-turn-helix domain-containing protein [Thermodesulfobacteriota bacterium]
MARKTMAYEGLSQTASKELKLLGEYIKIARKRRKISIRVFAERMMVSPPTVIALEKGRPSVSIGVFLQALTALSMDNHFSDFLAPENDKIGLGQEIRRIKAAGSRKHKKITELDLDF